MLTLTLEAPILDEVHRDTKKTDIAQRYKIAQSTLSTIINNASKIDAVHDDNFGSRYRERIQCATYGDAETA